MRRSLPPHWSYRCLQGQDPLHDVLEFFLIRGLDDPMLFFPIPAFDGWASRKMLDQALFRVSFAPVFGSNFAIGGAVFFLLDRMAFKAAVLTRYQLCRLGIEREHGGRNQPCQNQCGHCKRFADFRNKSHHFLIGAQIKLQ
jgi:hypothetical protein